MNKYISNTTNEEVRTLYEHLGVGIPAASKKNSMMGQPPTILESKGNSVSDAFSNAGVFKVGGAMHP